MAFSLRDFVKDGLVLAIGNDPDYKIKLAAADWLKNGVLVESDLAEIAEKIDEKNQEVV